MGTALGTTGNEHHTPCLIGVAILPLNPNAPHLVLGSSAEEDDGVHVRGEQYVHSRGTQCIFIHICVCVRFCVFVRASVRVRVYMRVYSHGFVICVLLSMCVRVKLCVFVCVFVHLCIARACSFVCLCVCTYLCMIALE
jgi:hypothetical protein